MPRRPDRNRLERLRALFNRLTTGLLEVKAEAHLAAREWEAATLAFEELLAREDKPPWREGLRKTVLHHATSLLERGSLKASRREVSRLSPEDWATDAAVVRLNLSLAERDWPGLAGGWAQVRRLGTELPAELSFRIEGYVGAARLIGKVPPLDPEMHGRLALWVSAAERALDSYVRADFDAMNQALAEIPFRSGLRDLVLVLRAARPGAGSAPARKLVSMVPPGSPFAPLATWVAAARDRRGLVSLRKVARAGKAGRNAFAELVGVSADLTSRIADWSLRADDADDNVERLPALRDDLQAAGMASNPIDHFLRRELPFAKTEFETGLDRLEPMQDERWRLRALHAEETGDGVLAAQCWLRYAETVEGETVSLGLDKRFVLAQVFHHVAELALELERLDFDVRSFDLDPIDLLERSVGLDPTQRRVWQTLLQCSANSVERERHRRFADWAEQALSHHPDDVDLHRTALTHYLETGDLTLATRLAGDLWRLDPLDAKPGKEVLAAALHLYRSSEVAADCEAWASLAEAVEPLCFAEPLLVSLLRCRYLVSSDQGAELQRSLATCASEVRDSPIKTAFACVFLDALGLVDQASETGSIWLKMLASWHPSAAEVMRLLAWCRPYVIALRYVEPPAALHDLIQHTCEGLDIEDEDRIAVGKSLLALGWFRSAGMMASMVDTRPEAVLFLARALSEDGSMPLPESMLAALEDAAWHLASSGREALADEIEAFLDELGGAASPSAPSGSWNGSHTRDTEEAP
ncbi:hypothetical protein [Sulfidibacter corallicola]|uniref:Uncharacterized protein n=1 Tax=Sulfidibacter corallicola TaxID=2818388 RepID=A0A8A4TTN5_SULCO|nr:hypothetical protein [Sulfidibacter corallicola]QTD52843.1 hypothetical protein J3U87_10230 [Sulfidibacter corallicola]